MEFINIKNINGKTIINDSYDNLVYLSFPKQKAAKIAIQTVKTFIDESSIIKKVIFNVFDDENLAIYQKLLAE